MVGPSRHRPPLLCRAPWLRSPSLPGRSLHHLGAAYEYGGFLVTLGDAVYDDTHKTLAVGVRYTNIGGEWHDALGQAELRDGGNTSAFSPNP